MLSTGDWISLLGSLALVAVGYGALRARVAALEEKVREGRDQEARSNEDQGRRIGALERWQEGVQKVEEFRRRQTGAIRAPQQEE